jgi:hypothetical protein
MSYLAEMDEAVYLLALKRIDENGLSIDEHEYSWSSFGSWYLTLAVNPRRRLVWDGKESWLIVQQEMQRESPNSQIEWDDVWIDRSATESSVEKALKILTSK